MTKLEEIKQDIAALNRDDFWKLVNWFDKHYAKLGDAQIEKDAKTGGFDKLSDE